MSKKILSKIGSKKFWTLIGGIVSSLLILFNVGEITIEKVLALVGAIGAMTCYMFYIEAQEDEKEGGE